MRMGSWDDVVLLYKDLLILYNIFLFYFLVSFWFCVFILKLEGSVEVVCFTVYKNELQLAS